MRATLGEARGRRFRCDCGRVGRAAAAACPALVVVGIEELCFLQLRRGQEPGQQDAPGPLCFAGVKVTTTAWLCPATLRMRAVCNLSNSGDLRVPGVEAPYGLASPDTATLLTNVVSFMRKAHRHKLALDHEPRLQHQAAVLAQAPYVVQSAHLAQLHLKRQNQSAVADTVYTCSGFTFTAARR